MRIAERLREAIALWVDGVSRRAVWVVVIAFLVTGLALRYTAGNLGMNTDTADMIDRSLPWRRAYIEYKELFPQYVNTLTLVIDGATPELADDASRRLTARLEQERDLVHWVYRPGSESYFETNGLLYLDLDELEALADNLAKVQPFLGKLAGDPTLRGLFALMDRALEAVADGEALDLETFLDQVSEGLEAGVTGTGDFHQLSWQALTLGRPATAEEKRRFVILKPKLDYSELLPAGPVLDRIRGLAVDEALVPAHGVRVRITGGTAVSHEELETVSRGAELAGIMALVLVSVVLVWGLRSLRLVVASLVTLIIGLIWTAAFAALAIGHLNLISVAFAVLYIGLGIAYAIHFSLRYRELVGEGQPHAEALRGAARDVGGALVLCAVTTGIGFYAFVPTDYDGVSELGLIAGTGMFIGLGASLTVLPALLSLMPLRAVAALTTPSGGGGIRLDELPYRYRRPVLVGAALLAVLGVVATAWARFDRNPMNLRDADTESVATSLELMAEDKSAGWTGVVLVDDAATARKLKGRLEALELVDEARTLADFVPEGQDEKLEIIEEMGLLTGPALLSAEAASPPDLPEQRAALAALRTRLDALLSAGRVPEMVASLERLREALGGVDGVLSGPAEAAERLAAKLQETLLGALPAQLERLDRALEADRVDLTDLPETIVERWVAPDGRQQVEIYATEDLLGDPLALRRFITAVRGVTPDVTGSPVTIMEAGDAVVGAFQQALMWALVLITALLLILLNPRRDAFLVLGPLLLGGLLTVAGMVLLDVPFNFANVIALPLLLGVGVDNGIHMVNRIRHAPPASGNVLRSSTGRAVIASALTTVCGFGNLALSPHPGTASMGLLLTIGLGFALVCTLVVLPAMLGPKAVAHG